MDEFIELEEIIDFDELEDDQLTLLLYQEKLKE